MLYKLNVRGMRVLFMASLRKDPPLKIFFEKSHMKFDQWIIQEQFIINK